ncbi:hypothetical protein I9W82_005478 [Candida metapsilosis]|uniref:Major facilitator superfamily (MFS) profile domain-containing protein n=1 Tax=Candida metapsilosis TaxID=273372 RepID=A0A8H7ZFR8_9ASCO|nr:hypothetical protein I9W82_005478 [Candida metapsilosis]
MEPTSDDNSSRHSVVDSLEAHNEIEPYHVHTLHSTQSQTSKASDQSKLSRYRTGQSELSRIITGIRDDQQLDEEEDKGYRERGDADFIMAQELDRAITRNMSRVQGTDIEGSSHESPIEKKEGEVDDYPVDGKFAWVMAICAMLASFVTWGANAGYGVFMNFYINSGTFPEATKYDFALIGSLVMFLANFLSPYSSILLKVLGLKTIFAIGLAFQTLGWIAASFATKVWHLYLSQGLAVGISFSFIFIPATLALPTWFVRRKAASMGICVAGTGLGGLIFSLSVNKTIQDTGNQRWALRMVGFVTLFVVAVIVILMRPRKTYPPQPSLKQRLTRTYITETVKVIFDFKVARLFGIQVVAVWFALALIGYSLMLFTMSSYATSIGLSHQQGSALTAVMNAAQLVGRPLLGFGADRIGRSNFTAIISLVIAILLYAYWINAKTYGSLMGFAVLIGLVIGLGSTMAQPLAADVLMGNLEQLPAGWSFINIFVSFFCLVAEVIALALVVKGASNPYLHTQIFSGTCFIACCLVMLVLREHLASKVLRLRYETAKVKLEQNKYNEDDDEEVLLERVERYEYLLRRSVIAYLSRVVYPIKV